VPGTAVPLTFIEVAGASRFEPTIHDPGAGMLRLRVRDIASITAKLKAAGGVVASAGGSPVTFANGQQMVVVHDPDNFFLQPVQAAPPQPPRGE
jgi:hypothetical protein